MRLRGFADPEAVSAVVGLGADVVAGELEKLRSTGEVTWRGGRPSGWTVTPAGRDEQERLLAEEVLGAGARPAVESVYGRFVGLNRALLEACTDWQLRDGVVNDHTDGTYDKNVVQRLLDVHEQLTPLLAELEGALDRYRCYRPRLETALDRLQAGAGDWFTKPMIDSYHTVWFQLHEDLLNTLGLDRADEEEP